MSTKRLGLPGSLHDPRQRVHAAAHLTGHNNSLPVIIVPPPDPMSDRIARLNAGADDYLARRR